MCTYRLADLAVLKTIYIDCSFTLFVLFALVSAAVFALRAMGSRVEGVNEWGVSRCEMRLSSSMRRLLDLRTNLHNSGQTRQCDLKKLVLHLVAEKSISSYRMKKLQKLIANK